MIKTEDKEQVISATVQAGTSEQMIARALQQSMDTREYMDVTVHQSYILTDGLVVNNGRFSVDGALGDETFYEYEVEVRQADGPNHDFGMLDVTIYE